MGRGDGRTAGGVGTDVCAPLAVFESKLWVSTNQMQNAFVVPLKCRTVQSCPLCAAIINVNIRSEGIIAKVGARKINRKINEKLPILEEISNKLVAAPKSSYAKGSKSCAKNYRIEQRAAWNRKRRIPNRWQKLHSRQRLFPQVAQQP